MDVIDYDRALSPFLGHDLPAWDGDQYWLNAGRPLREIPQHQVLLAESVLNYQLPQYSMYLIPPGIPYGPLEQWLIYLVGPATESMLAPSGEIAKRVMAGVVAHHVLHLVEFGGKVNRFGETADGLGVRALVHRMSNGECIGFGAVAENEWTWLVCGLVNGAPFAESLTSLPAAETRLGELMIGSDPEAR